MLQNSLYFTDNCCTIGTVYDIIKILFKYLDRTKFASVFRNLRIPLESTNFIH
jgi:hypothetical protein